jgi:8-oxo-dGTP pyrophosphatase MutT (NUDIX family)
MRTPQAIRYDLFMLPSRESRSSHGLSIVLRLTAGLRQALEPALRVVLHSYWRMTRGLTLGVRGVVFNAAGEVFLVKHSYIAGWHLPGGGVEPGETLLTALARELQEEGNIEIIGAPALHGIFFNDRISRRDHVAVYVVRDFRQATWPAPNHEIIGHGFYPLDALPDGATAATRARIAEITRGVAMSAHW